MAKRIKKKARKKARKKVLRKPKNKKQKAKKIKKKIIKQGVEKIKLKKIEQKPQEEQPKRKYKLRITDNKIKKLLDFEHLEELFYLLHILNDEQIESFIRHYKDSEISATKDKKIDSIIKKSETCIDLGDNLRKELVNSLENDYEKVKERISTLRKKGKDVYIEEIKSMSIPFKIRIFSATSDKQDFYKIKKMFSVIDNTLKLKEQEVIEEERKKEIEEQAKIKNAIFIFPLFY